MKITITNLVILLIVLTKHSKGQNLNGSATYSKLEEPFQFQCSVAGFIPSSRLYFKRASVTICTISNPGVLSNCSQTQSAPGYTCVCETSGIFSLNITRIGLQDEATWSCEVNSQSQNNILLPVYYGPYPNITMNSSTSVMVVEGAANTPTVRCTAVCSPECIFTWWKGATQASTNQDLSLPGFRRGQEGDYSCRAVNTFTNKTANGQTLTVAIQWPPAKPTHDCPSSIVLGKTGSCTCRTSDRGKPAGTLTWLDPGNNQVSSTSSTSLQLNLRSIPRSNNKGRYTCSINNTHGTENESYTVDIKFGPVGVTITGNVQTEIGSTVNLTCTTTGPVNPEPTLTWKNSTTGSALGGSGPERVGSSQDGGYVFRSTLSINPYWYNNGNTVVCEGRNPGITNETSVRDSVVLNITYPPAKRPVISGLPIGSITEGTSLTLTCKIEGGHPLVTRVNLTCPVGASNTTTSTEGRSTRVTSLTFPVRREWRTQPCVCSGDNPAGSYKLTRTITKDDIYYAPDLTVTNPTANEPDATEITCIADGNPENFVFDPFLQVWNGHFIRNVSGRRTGRQYKKQFSLTSYQDSGVYVCTVSYWISDLHGVEQRTENNSLTILAPPKLTAGLKSRPTVGAALYENITLNRTIYSRSKLTRYTWTKGGKNLNNAQSSQTSSSVELDIYGVRVQDTGYKITLNVGPFDHLRDPGEYSLQVCNSRGCPIFYIDLIADGPPAIPTQFKVFKILENAVDLTWKAEFPGGAYNQVFIVEYRRQGGGWKDYKEPMNGTEGELVTAEVTGLTEGTRYEFRVSARTSNYKGGYTASVQATTKEKAESAPNIAGPVAGTIICVLLAAAVGVGVFILYRRGYRCSVAKPASNTSNEPENERPYYENVASAPQKETATYAKLEVKGSSHSYDQFTPTGKKTESTTQTIDSGDSLKTYENVAMQIYENTSINVKTKAPKTKPKPKPKPKNNTKDPTYANAGFLKSRGK